jgi:hypothetical protein
MKQIQGMKRLEIHIPAKSQVNMGDAVAVVSEAQFNKVCVIEFAAIIEDELSELISYYFFGERHERKNQFHAMILASDAATFAFKRRVAVQIVNELELLSGAEKQELDSSLRKVISLRNAFTHGKFSSDGKTVWLSYFEGSPRKIELTDDYLAEAEHLLHRVFKTCFSALEKMGKKITQYSVPNESPTKTTPE